MCLSLLTVCTGVVCLCEMDVIVIALCADIKEFSM